MEVACSPYYAFVCDSAARLTILRFCGIANPIELRRGIKPLAALNTSENSEKLYNINYNLLSIQLSSKGISSSLISLLTS